MSAFLLTVRLEWALTIRLTVPRGYSFCVAAIASNVFWSVIERKVGLFTELEDWRVPSGGHVDYVIIHSIMDLRSR